MKNSSFQALTLGKIARSIEQSWTLEQILSTEQFLTLYYRRFDFQSQYLEQEWKMDTYLREKIQLLTALEGVQRMVFDRRKPSLKRLEAYLKTLSQREFEREWAQLQTQLAEVSVVEMSRYPLVCQLTATLSVSSPNFVEEFGLLPERKAKPDQHQLGKTAGYVGSIGTKAGWPIVFWPRLKVQ